MDQILTGHIGTEHPLIVNNPYVNSINATATATPGQIASGVIKSTSASAVTITTPTAAAIMAELGLLPGSYFDFIVDNTAGSNTVTISLDGSIVAQSKLTGGETLTNASGKAGAYRLYFYSATAAFIAVLF